MARHGRRPGMMDVAKLAGVSHQTVSRVLNQPESVRAKTRERVEVAMAELGYSPNLAARALVTSQSALLGVVWTGANYFGPSSTVAGIEVAARSAGYSTIVGALTATNEGDVGGIFSSFRARGVDGIAVVAPYDRMLTLAQESAGGIPTVLVGDIGPDSGLPVVSVDQELGARLATQHLVDGGARRILHISGPPDWFDAKSRIRGWRRTLEEAGLDVPEVIVGDWSAPRGYQLAQELVDADDLPDAVFCGNDVIALGLLAGFRDRGVDVPGQVSVVGFDDIDGADYFAPPLTTVRQPFEELGGLCVEALVDAMGEAAPTVRTLAPTLKVRASSAAASPAHN